MSYYPFNGAPAFDYQAFRYSGGSMTGLGFLSGLSGAQSVANGVSGNGSVVVGWSQSSNGAVTPGDRYEAFRWTGGTMSGLGYLPGGVRSIATGTNSDGSVVVGFGFNSSGPAQAFRWTAATGMVGLGFLPGGSLSQATATNADGSVVVGNTDQGEAFSWTAKKGMVGLSGLNQANAVSANGSIIVGQSSSQDAMVWTRQTGAESIQQLLLDDGINLAGWLLEDATGISADGTVIVGDGIDPQGNNEAWIADIPHIRHIPGLANSLDTILADPADPVTPIPSALPLFATGLGAIGLLGWRRKRKAQAVA
jgi:probable HAF family extracellular repeat protein